MSDDAHLLRQYAEDGSSHAFATLVQRHLPMVYRSVARQLGADGHLAEDVAQSVFVLLAGKSRVLLGHPNLAAWLHATAHFKVAEARRAERRRRTREDTALQISTFMPSELSDYDWQRLRPMIDDALLEMRESDREAVLLRFFEERSFSEIALALNLNESAANKRVERALEKLRRRLAQRGVVSTAAALALSLGGPAALATPPSGLLASVTGAVATVGVPAATASGVVASVSAFMNTKLAATAAAFALVVGGGLATKEVLAERELARRVRTLETENASLAARLRGRQTQDAVAPIAPSSAMPSRTANKSPQASAVARSLGSGGLASREESREFLRANPDVRQALATYNRNYLAAEYAELIRTLGLTDIQRDRFLDTLAAGHTRIVGEHQLSLGEKDFTPKEYGEKLREALGLAGYEQYRKFHTSDTQRQLLRELTASVYFTPSPLAPSQGAALETIVTQAIVDAAPGGKNPSGSYRSLPLPVWDRIIKSASTVLPEAQVEALRELRQQARYEGFRLAASTAYRAKQSDGKALSK